ERVEAIHSKSIWTSVLHARISMAQQNFFSARQILEEAIACSPNEVVLRIVLSHALLQEGKDWPAAEIALNKILELDPGNAEAKMNLSKLLGKSPLVAI